MKAIKILLTGILFDIVLIKSEVISWCRILEMFRFESFNIYRIIESAVITGVVLLELSKQSKIKTIEGNPVVLGESKALQKGYFGR